MAWAETSQTTYSTFLQYISLTILKKFTVSGVVKFGGNDMLSYFTPFVPISPAFLPAELSICQIILEIVVLPLVPVTPTNLSLLVILL